MKVLVIWIDVPEEWNFLVLHATEPVFEKLKSFNGRFINGGDEEIDEKMLEMFFLDGEFKYKDSLTKEPQYGHFDAILTMGFIL